MHIRNTSAVEAIQQFTLILERNGLEINDWAFANDAECEGHPDGPVMGETFYCDGTCRAKERPERLRYVNAYEVEREHGGPEEGGWWYDSGVPVFSVLIVSHKDLEKAIRLVYDIWYEAVQGNRPYTSVLGGLDIELRLEADKAVAFPTEVPTYS